MTETEKPTRPIATPTGGRLATLAMMSAFAQMAAPPSDERLAAYRQKRDEENHWRISQTDFAAQARERAEAKRARRRLRNAQLQSHATPVPEPK